MIKFLYNTNSEIIMKISIISGASSGIGKEIALKLDMLNLDEMWLIALDNDGLVSLSKKLKTKARIFPLNLMDSSSFELIKNELDESKPEVEYLVCCAGVGYNGNFDKITEKNISFMINLNCLALTLLTKCVDPYIVDKGRIIEIASGSGFAPQPGFAVYAATKSYVISFSRALKRELRHRKIAVTAVCPGPVDTAFFASLEGVKEYKKKFVITPEKVAIKAVKSSKKRKALCVPSMSMKLFHLASKILPTSLLLKFYK